MLPAVSTAAKKWSDLGHIRNTPSQFSHTLWRGVRRERRDRANADAIPREWRATEACTEAVFAVMVASSSSSHFKLLHSTRAAGSPRGINWGIHYDPYGQGDRGIFSPLANVENEVGSLYVTPISSL